MLNGSAYDHYAQQYVARGLHPVVIGPRTKKPQHHTSNGFVNTPSWQSRPVITTPQPGADLLKPYRLCPQRHRTPRIFHNHPTGMHTFPFLILISFSFRRPFFTFAKSRA